MDTLLQGMKGISVYLDDVLVTGATLEEHLDNLNSVLYKLEEANLHLKVHFCSHLSSSM